MIIILLLCLRQTDDDEDSSFEPLNFATSGLESKWFNLLAETKILIHGYIQDYQTDIIVNMKDGKSSLPVL